MITRNLLRWQWENYPHAHRDRTNLLIHAVSAPLCALSFWSAVAAFGLGHAALGGVALVVMVICVAAQAKGHRLEAEDPAPFRSPLDVVARLLVEQLITFPRFVLSGRFESA